MNAWLLDHVGSIDSLQLRSVPDPVPGESQVLLELHYAALNPADRYLAEGQYPAKPSFPHILGRDGIGTVIAVGSKVKDVKIGDVKSIVRGDTGVNTPGTFAQRVAVDADSVIDPPANWSPEQTAGATLVYLTAYQAITQWGDLPVGTTLASTGSGQSARPDASDARGSGKPDPYGQHCVTLVTGASGGVGVAVVQLAKAMGHTVVGLSRDAGKREQVKELGADFAFDPSDKGWTKTLTKEHKKRVNLVVDNVGGDGFNDLLSVMDMNGRLSVVGRLAGPVPEFNTAALFFRRLRIGGVAVGTYTREEAHTAWKALVGLMDKSGAKPLVDQIFDFEKLPDAFARLQKGPMGKVLLRVKKD
jgi:NADPH2:quinone reductase